MGQVYRATDTTLGRTVAIKILPDAFANNPERLARFEREAKTLASLNHPHIAAIYGFEKSAGMHALVMEFVEGEDLSRRIAGRAIPIDEALPIAKQIAEALEAAHQQGIIHRDLKPANIKVRADGTVKVLDFGLAKAMEPAADSFPSLSLSPTITTPAMTHAGMILGTAAYMSPEQARGKTVDRRTDIWAFGAVLYEMLTGKRAFGGDGVQDTLAAIMRDEPDWARLPATLSPALATFIRRCLHKDPRQRIHDIADVRLALEGAFEAVVPHAAAPAARPTSGVARAMSWVSSAAALVFAIAWLTCGRRGARKGRWTARSCGWTSIWARMSPCPIPGLRGVVSPSLPTARGWPGYRAHPRSCSRAGWMNRRPLSCQELRPPWPRSSHRTGSGWDSSPLEE
jgi:serine/threonine protein kinase